MNYIFKAERISLPETESNAYQGIKGDLIPVHDELCVERTIMEEVGRSQWAPSTIRTEDNSAPIIHVKRNGDMLMNFRAVTGAMPHQIDDPRWVAEQTLRCSDAVSMDDIALADIAEAIEFIQLIEEDNSINIFINPEFAEIDDVPPVIYYRPEDSDDLVRLCEELKKAGYLFVKESEGPEDEDYMSIVNPSRIISICYHEDDTHGLGFACNDNIFFGAGHTRAEMIAMIGEEEYYDKAFFHDWETFEQIPLRGLTDEYLSSPPADSVDPLAPKS